MNKEQLTNAIHEYGKSVNYIMNYIRKYRSILGLGMYQYNFVSISHKGDSVVISYHYDGDTEEEEIDFVYLFQEEEYDKILEDKRREEEENKLLKAKREEEIREQNRIKAINEARELLRSLGEL